MAAIVERVHRGTLDLESLCIGCHREVMGISHQHPLFRGALCAVCLVEIQETSYAIAEDEIRVGCAVCGSTGDCLVCDRDACCRSVSPFRSIQVPANYGRISKPSIPQVHLKNHHLPFSS